MRQEVSQSERIGWLVLQMKGGEKLNKSNKSTQLKNKIAVRKGKGRKMLSMQKIMQSILRLGGERACKGVQEPVKIVQCFRLYFKICRRANSRTFRR